MRSVKFDHNPQSGFSFSMASFDSKKEIKKVFSERLSFDSEYFDDTEKTNVHLNTWKEIAQKKTYDYEREMENL